MILVTHFACCHQYKGYWRSCPLGWSYFTVMPGLNLRAGGAHAPEFTLLAQTAHVCFHEQKRVHTRLCSKDRTQRLTRRNRGHFGWGAIITLDTYCTFTNIPGPGTRTACFTAFGAWSWVLPKNAESLRDSDALMRVAVPQASRPRWAA